MRVTCAALDLGHENNNRIREICMRLCVKRALPQWMTVRTAAALKARLRRASRGAPADRRALHLNL